MDEIRRRVFEGRVLIKVNFKKPCTSESHDYLLIAHRIHYFHLYFDQIVEYFKPYTTPGFSFWLQYKSEVLTNERPIGLLKDLLTAEKWSPDKLNANFDVDDIWEIDFLTSKHYPLDKLGYTPKGLYKDFFIQRLKESCYMRNGSSLAVMESSQESLDKMWTTYKQANFKEYIPLYDDLVYSSKTRTEFIVPLIIFDVYTLFSKYRKYDSTTPLKSVFTNSDYVKIHGISIPVDDTPLGSLYECMAYPDGFIYGILVSEKQPRFHRTEKGVV